MKKAIIAWLAAIVFFSCGAQTNRNNTMENNLVKYPVSVGSGLLEVSFNKPVPLYRTENDSEPFDVLTFRQDREGVLHYETKHLKSFKPYTMYGGDSNEEASQNVSLGLVRNPPVLAFRVTEAGEGYYRVVVDEESFETVVIRKDPGYAELPQHSGLFGMDMPDDRDYKGYYAYETWEHLLKRAEFVYVLQPVYDAPEGNKIFENTERLPYNVTEVCGDWMKVVRGYGREFHFEGIENAEGWVKWNDGKKISVFIIEYTVE